MSISVKNVVPDPMRQYTFGPESIWGNQETVVFEKGKNYIIKAHSGKGKSTLVAYLYGLRGDVRYNNKDVKEIGLMEWASIRQTKFSIALQDLRLFPKLSVIDNLRLKNQLTNYKTEKEIQEMLERFGIGEKTDQTCGTLSYGQQQRVALIRALLQPFDYLMMDEPFSHLDVENQKIGCAMINEACQQNGSGIIIASLGEDYFFTYDKLVTV